MSEHEITEPGEYTRSVTFFAESPGVYRVSAERVGDLPIPPPPPPPPIGGFTDGAIPVDGHLSDDRYSSIVRPAVLFGQRLSGIVTIEAENIPDGAALTWRLLVDGVAQASKTIDTNQWSDGSHVIATQIMDQAGLRLRSQCAVVVINNSGEPYTDLKQQAVIGHGCWEQMNLKPSLAWGRVDVLPQVAYPLDPQLSRHPLAVTDEDRTRLETEKIWWLEGINHQSTRLWRTLPILARNLDGDVFIQQWNPEGGGAGAHAGNAEPWMRVAPAYDGPRGIGNISPYTTFSADRHKTLASGETGWIGIEKSGRVVRMDIDGTLETILGPRSVEGVIGTDPYCRDFTLEDRLAAGEKEYIGNHNGLPLRLPHDLWVCDSFPFEGVIADQLNDRVVEIHFDDQKLMRSWPIRRVTSVWGSIDLQRKHHIAWVAANPEGLWIQRVIATENCEAVLGEDGKPTIGPDGHILAHLPPELICEIHEAFWVRVLGERIFILTLDLGIYEYDLATGVLTERKARCAYNKFFIFAVFDEFGAIGSSRKLYWSHSVSKCSVYWLDIDTWETGQFGALDGRVYQTILNRQVYGSLQAITAPFGHYMWGFAPHASLPKAIMCGATDSSWRLMSACLGQVPELEQRLPRTGLDEMQYGTVDKKLPIGQCWGFNGHGMIGYSCDQFREFKTWEEGREAVMAAIGPFCHGWDDDTKESVGKHLFAQRTRTRF